MHQIRTYQDADFDEILLLLNRSLQFDQFSENLLKEKLYMDPSWNPETTLIAEEDGKIKGFMQGVSREIGGEAYAYLKLFVVKEEYRRKGIASDMLHVLEGFFSELGCKYFRLMDVPLNYYMPGIDPRYTEAVCFALNTGFKRNGEALNMMVDLNDRSWDTLNDISILSTYNIEIRRAGEQDVASLMDLISKEWALWEHELRSAMANDVPTVFVAIHKGKVKAFAAYDANNKGTGWFGPMGTDVAVRGKGLGRILLYLCLDDMHNSGLEQAIIPWVDPVSFYSHFAGARINRVFWRFEKEIKK